jgi:hypothetical protein
MAKQGFCRTGQVAQALGLSAHQVRRLCETGLVKAERGPGGQWRVAAHEVARLQKEGVLLIPSAVDDLQPEKREPRNKSGAMVQANPRHNLVAPLTQTLIASDDEAHIVRNYLEVPGIGEATELETDWFSERKRQREENQADASRTLIGQQAALQAVNTREHWHHRWLEWALNSVPWDVPNENRLDVRQEVDKTLQSLQPQTPESLTRKLVEGAVQQGLRTWRRAKDTEKALDDALRWRPWLASSFGRTTKWQVRAREEASSAILNLPDSASFEAKLAAATAGVQKITLEFEEETLRKKIIDESIPLSLLSSAEKEDAKTAIRTSLESLRQGSTEAELRRARQAALRPFEDAHRQKENWKRLEWNVGLALGHIWTFLDQLWDHGELEGFEDRSEVWRYANELREDVRAKVLEKLAGTQEVSDHKIKTMIEDVVDDRLSD